MATNVRLKDAAGNVLHPETDWSLVQNKPSIEVNQTSHVEEGWSFGGYINISSGYGLRLISSGAAIKIRDQQTNGVKNLADYPINYSAINGKPSFNLISYENIGYYEHTSYTGEKTTSLACKFFQKTQSGTTTTKYFYLNSGGTWTSFTPKHAGTENITFEAISCLRQSQ